MRSGMKLVALSVGFCQRTCIPKLAAVSSANFHAASGLACEAKDGKNEEKARKPADISKTDTGVMKSAGGKKDEVRSDGNTKAKRKEGERSDEKRKEVKVASVDKAKLEAAQKRLQALLKGFGEEQPTEKQVEIPRPKEKKSKKKRVKVTSELEAAVSGVADVIGSQADKESVKAELMARVKAAEDGLPAYNKEELLQAITGLKDRIRLEEEQKKKEEEEKKAKEAEKAAEAAKRKEKRDAESQATFKKRERAQPTAPRVRLFEAEPLGIFVGKDGTPLIPASQFLQSGLSTWNAARERELKLAVARPPANGFEEMIQWTEQGKLWKFPIDNEYGLDEEALVGFHEHIFLEPHLEPWCPKAGPVRHFMELVCVGLSKNPWLTVQEKKRHILWFKDYFAEKLDLLKETHAVDESGAERLLKPLEGTQ